MTQPYKIPSQSVETAYEIKKSRFIARLVHAESREIAMQALEKARADYPDARHHCWAYLLGSPVRPESMAMSDDGEPSGTAGRPILNVMQHQDIGDVMLVVIRYFGGIKLGAGGLVKAYSQATKQAYEHVGTTEKIFLEEIKLYCDFSDEQNIRHWLNANKGIVIRTNYQQNVEMICMLPPEQKKALSKFLDTKKLAHLDQRKQYNDDTTT